MTMKAHLTGLTVAFAVLGMAARSEAQSISITDRITWEEALLALEEGNEAHALVLLDDVIDSAGPVPEILYDAAWVSFEAREYERAEGYIMAVLETDDTQYKSGDQYDDAFRLAAEIRRALRPIRDRLVNATPLPYTDSLARMGFAREERDRAGACEWRFDRGGLLVKHDDRQTCVNGNAATTGRVRIEITVERRGGGSKSSGGIVFGREDANNYYFLRVHPRWTEMGGDMSLVHVADGHETVLMTAVVPDNRGRPLRSWNGDGPWRLSVEIRGRKVDWSLNGEHAGTGHLDDEVRGTVMAGVSGTDNGEYVFSNLAINSL